MNHTKSEIRSKEVFSKCEKNPEKNSRGQPKKCISFAAENGGQFWPVLGKALDQVVKDFELPKLAEKFLRNLFEGKIEKKF